MPINKQQSGRKNAADSLICWVDYLTVFSLLKLIGVNGRTPIAEVRYLEVVPIVKKLIPFLEKILFPIQPMTRNRKYSCLNDAMNTLKSFPDTGDKGFPTYKRSLETFLAFTKGRYNTRKLAQFFDYTLAQELLLPLLILEDFKEAYQYDKNVLSRRCVALFQDMYLFSQVKACFGGEFRDILPYPNVKNFIIVWFQTLKILFEISICRVILLFKGRETQPVNQEKNKARVAVLYTQGANPAKKCDFYWLPKSGLDPRDILVYFKHQGRPPTPKIVEQLAQQGIPWVSVMPFTLKLKPVLPLSLELNILPSKKFVSGLKTLFQFNWQCLRMYWQIKDRGFLWFWSRAVLMFDDMYLFEALFESHQVKMHYSNYEAGRHMFAANFAIDRLGGIDLCHHWSNYDFVDVHISKPHDVHFIWGRYFLELLNRPFNDVQYFVLTGYPYDYLFDLNKPQAGDFRRQLQQKGVKTIIGFFDQEVIEGVSQWLNSQEMLYAFLLNEVIVNKEIGLMIKPKKAELPDGLNKKFPRLSSLIDQARATGRCIILDSSSQPCEASLASDLVVGTGITSTPSIEAAFNGIKSITFSGSEWIDNPMYKAGLGRIVFDNFDELIRIIKDFEAGRAAPDLGDYSFILNEVDPFQDGKARERIGFFIKTLQECFIKDRDKQQALKYTTDAYQKYYGTDKVFEPQREEVMK